MTADEDEIRDLLEDLATAIRQEREAAAALRDARDAITKAASALANCGISITVETSGAPP